MNNITPDSLFRTNKNLIKAQELLLNTKPIGNDKLYINARISHIHNTHYNDKPCVLGMHKQKEMIKVNTIHHNGKSRGVWIPIVPELDLKSA